MNRYYVRIDGQETPKSYSYEELRSMGVLDFDDIQIRKTLDSTWYSAKYYNFPESSPTPDIEIDEYGQIRNSPSRNNIQIDEFGQIRGVTTSSSSSSTSSSSSSNSSSSSSSFSESSKSSGSSSSSSSSSGDGVANFFRVIGTIALIAIGIALVSSGYGAPVAVACAYGIREIWKDVV